MQYRPQPNLISTFTTTKNKHFTGSGTSTSVGGIKVIYLLFSQRGSFFDTVRLRFLFGKLQNSIKFVKDAPKSRPDRAGNVPFQYFVASPAAGTATCGSHAAPPLKRSVERSALFVRLGLTVASPWRPFRSQDLSNSD